MSACNDSKVALAPTAKLSFAANDDGAITIFAMFAFVMVIGMIGLLVDVGRVMNIHSQAYSYSDRVALAAAAELDQRPDALTRAIRAARDPALRHVETGSRISLDGDVTPGIEVRRLTFMSEIGPDAADPYAPSPLPGDVVTATWEPASGIVYAAGWDASSAVSASTFVLVDITQETENYVFFPVVAALAPGLDLSATVAPQALAGFERQLCNYPPIFVCNLAEATAGAGAPFDPVRGQQILAKAGGGGAGWGPGNFGLIEAPDGHGASAVREYMARRDPNTRCTKETIVSKPGSNTGPVSQGMNVRMDMYDGPMAGKKNNAQYSPAPNVLKGLRTQGGGCQNPKSSTSTPFPRDNCFMPNAPWPDGAGAASGAGCTFYNGVARAGDGEWARADYWATNHAGAAQPPGYASMTRYDIYRYEIETPELSVTAEENAAPSCSSSPTTANPSLDRRVIPIAVVNCLADPPQGQSHLTDVVGYLDVFLTEPVGNSAWWGADNKDLFIEVISFVRANTATSVLREYPVLYR